VGYSQRFRRNIFLCKQYIQAGKLGRIVGASSRVLNSRAQAFSILQRAPDVSPVVDVLTYWIDVLCWFMPDNRPVEVFAAGQGVVLREGRGGDGPDDLTTAVIRYAVGGVASFTICYSLPAEFPTLGQGSRIEVIGSDGVLLLDEDNRQNVIFSDLGIDHAYVPDHYVKMAYLGTTSSGDWALGQMFGPIADETRAWLDHLSAGAPMGLATVEEARLALEVTLAIEESVASGQPVTVTEVGVPPVP
jgi:predicted dehydrogenase